MRLVVVLRHAQVVQGSPREQIAFDLEALLNQGARQWELLFEGACQHPLARGLLGDLAGEAQEATAQQVHLGIPVLVKGFIEATQAITALQAADQVPRAAPVHLREGHAGATLI
ncbi:MAG TPA: hypothetical protein VJA19_16080, partial [Pseudomonas sp.]|nr:hypothetical protein [Pseudomonas sp.]